MTTTSREESIRLAEELFKQDKAAGTIHENGEDAMVIWYQAIRQAEGDDAVEPFREHRGAMEEAYDAKLIGEAEGETSEHVHAAVSTTERPFSECVRPYACGGAAHGGITLIETCSCGASRSVNVNGRHGESGPWRMPETSEDTDAEDEEASKPVCKLRIVYEHGGWTPFVVFGTGAPTRIDQAVARAEVALYFGLKWILDKDGYLAELEIVSGDKRVFLCPEEFEMGPEVQP